MKSKLRTLTVLGCEVRVAIKQVEDGYECAFDPRNFADTRRDLIASGRGETETEAVKAYVAECQRLERLPPGTLYK